MSFAPSLNTTPPFWKVVVPVPPAARVLENVGRHVPPIAKHPFLIFRPLVMVVEPVLSIVKAAGLEVAYVSVVVPIENVPPCEENSQCLRLVPAPLSVRTRFLPVVVASWRSANGEVVPRPRLPVAELKKNDDCPRLPKTTVEEANNPPCAKSAEVVAEVTVL